MKSIVLVITIAGHVAWAGATCESLAMFSGVEEQPVPELAA